MKAEDRKAKPGVNIQVSGIRDGDIIRTLVRKAVFDDEMNVVSYHILHSNGEWKLYEEYVGEEEGIFILELSPWNQDELDAIADAFVNGEELP